MMELERRKTWWHHRGREHFVGLSRDDAAVRKIEKKKIAVATF